MRSLEQAPQQTQDDMMSEDVFMRMLMLQRPEGQKELQQAEQNSGVDPTIIELERRGICTFDTEQQEMMAAARRNYIDHGLAFEKNVVMV